MAVLTLTLSSSSYLPLGFVAAIIVVRVFNLQTKPALATDNVCCSIASCMVARSLSRMVENSSMQHTPLSAKTKAPASNIHSPPSRMAVQVKPALVEPMPVVVTLLGLNFAAYLKN